MEAPTDLLNEARAETKSFHAHRDVALTFYHSVGEELEETLAEFSKLDPELFSLNIVGGSIKMLWNGMLFRLLMSSFRAFPPDDNRSDHLEGTGPAFRYSLFLRDTAVGDLFLFENGTIGMTGVFKRRLPNSYSYDEIALLILTTVKKFYSSHGSLEDLNLRTYGLPDAVIDELTTGEVPTEVRSPLGFRIIDEEDSGE